MNSILTADLSIINGYLGKYAINRKGEIYSKRPDGDWKKLKPYIVSGYEAVSLMKDKKRDIQLVHRLLAMTFIENPEGKKCVSHLDGNKLNNSLDNLEWKTNSEYSNHSFAIGLNNNLGVRCHTSKLNEQKARAIFILKDCYTQSELSRMFNVTPNAIMKIHKGISWKNEIATLD